MVRSILPVHWVNLDKETEPGQVLELDHNFSHSCDDKRNTANISFFCFRKVVLDLTVEYKEFARGGCF